MRVERLWLGFNSAVWVASEFEEPSVLQCRGSSGTGPSNKGQVPSCVLWMGTGETRGLEVMTTSVLDDPS